MEVYACSSWIISYFIATNVVLICLPTWPKFWIMAVSSGTTCALVFSKRMPLINLQHFLSSSSLLTCSSTSLERIGKNDWELVYYDKMVQRMMVLSCRSLPPYLFILTRSPSFRLRPPWGVGRVPASLGWAAGICEQSSFRSLARTSLLQHWPVRRWQGWEFGLRATPCLLFWI